MFSSHNKSGSKSDLIFAADLGGTHLRAAVVGRDGKIHYRLKQPTPQAEKPDGIVHALVDAAHEGARHTAAGGGQISAVAIAVPGTVNFEDGVVVKAPNVPCLDGFRLAAALESELKWPATLENDANAAAAGEMWQGAGRGYSNIVCVTLGTGVGGGIIIDGKLWRGADGSAAEIGHLGVDPFGGVPCACGSRGCLEVYASATAIVRMTREARPRYPDSILHTSEDLASETVYQAGLEGDELALEVFRRMGVYLGIGLASLINLLNPEIIVIGGGLSNGWELFEQHMHQQVIERAFPLPARSVKITRAECGDDAGFLGAARLAFAGQQPTKTEENQENPYQRTRGTL
ncbi:MAG: ROK family glucokinase [Pyrinomonadaceae bacterium]|nr:ROK family glucokinase [Pyrinomonadaceae bacterium]MBA3570749.1 ROK family glucokinase [Pyrinomonadaceae bacterium]MDQ3172924.1 ROK family glucokinase [Acidobacteriota bacterium]